MKMLLTGFLWTCSLSLAAGKLRMAAFSPGMFSEEDFEVGNGTSLSSINQEKILISWEGLNDKDFHAVKQGLTSAS